MIFSMLRHVEVCLILSTTVQLAYTGPIFPLTESVSVHAFGFSAEMRLVHVSRGGRKGVALLGLF